MKLILLNKPYDVMCQFSAHPTRQTLADYVDVPNVYPAGRLDADSEGLVLLTDNGKLQHSISHPDLKQAKTYLVQVEGQPSPESLTKLRNPLDLGDFVTKPCQVKHIYEPDWLWDRTPPIRYREDKPTSWLSISLTEGKNRQVRRMTAAVGLPTLRLIRSGIANFTLESHALMPGSWQEVSAEWLARIKSGNLGNRS
ncbi:pseudouridine synthase [Undibacterium sp. RTI2.1]|uniref:pseudouridine synthase n=1 Tax=unclassified Undibacterium TaxID=2630295 RepID=UPI002AB4C31A|nr:MULTISPECIES: pseudouridine synthase [unclassified Undibacterium]MDY7536888.1 pseudouridine synthase [Undibacterium sp. 5I1]MEB0031682.1 pseudouridine synthase [Undibacterium sp. RTI2.1]MEB0117953.1 pseudouridine synthase [Undibacterium sp. RTI2.2]MEB0230393.1 pseudouridine synthase [Undibacterium sp. 10I3]MEB0258811.1 pseudouridine synthase [Undibacterium sp. 5I1]